MRPIAPYMYSVLSTGVTEQAPQSPAQVEHVSSPLHTLSPHVGLIMHAPQSLGHEEHVSTPLHVWSPHVGAGGQSAGQVAVDSEA